MSRPLTFFLALLIVGCPTEGSDDDDTNSPNVDDDDETVANDDDTTVADDDDSSSPDDDDSGDDDDSPPVPVGAWTRISCDNRSVCVLDEAGQPFCAYSPFLGLGPGLFPGPQGIIFVEIAARSDGGCGLDAAGYLTCWDSSGSIIPTEVSEPLYSLQSTCALAQSDQHPVPFWGWGAFVGGNSRAWEQMVGGELLWCGRASTGIFCSGKWAGAHHTVLSGEFVDLAGVGSPICGLDVDGDIHCKCCNGSCEGTYEVLPGQDWVALSGAWGELFCASDADGWVSCFGPCGAPGGSPPTQMLAVCDGDLDYTCGIELGTNDIRCWTFGSPLPESLEQFAYP